MRDIDKIERVMAEVAKPSGWRAKAEARKANSAWLKRSTEISLRILDEMEAQGINQAEFARRMDVSPQHISKLLKGQENLTLETVDKIETVLGIRLITVNSASNVTESTVIKSVSFSENISIAEPIPKLSMPESLINDLVTLATISFVGNSSTPKTDKYSLMITNFNKEVCYE